MKRDNKQTSIGKGREWGFCTCVDLQEWALLFVDGDLPDEPRRQLLIHIQVCNNCARLVRSLKRTVHLCHLEPGPEVPEKTHQKLWQVIREVTAIKKSRR